MNLTLQFPSKSINLGSIPAALWEGRTKNGDRCLVVVLKEGRGEKEGLELVAGDSVLLREELQR